MEVSAANTGLQRTPGLAPRCTLRPRSVRATAMIRKVKGIESWLDEKSLSLEEWLGYLNLPERKRPRAFVSYCFPSDHHFKEYVSTLHQRTDREVKMLLRNFLITGGGLGVDGDRLFE